MLTTHNINNENLFEVIKCEVIAIENELKLLDKGVFFAPELYVGFRIAKSIYLHRQRIFNSANVKWNREVKLGKDGPSDIVFEFGDKNCLVIELKLRDTFDKYHADILKQERLVTKDKCANYFKYFCVLLDSFTKQNDERIDKLYKVHDLVKIGHYPFPTNQDWYKTQVFCNLNLIQIN